MNNILIPNIDEIRVITEERNRKDIKEYMDQARAAFINGIQQDAHSGHYRHIHTWMDAGKTNLTTRTSENFKRALEKLKLEFEEAGYSFHIAYGGEYEGQKCITHVIIAW